MSGNIHDTRMSGRLTFSPVRRLRKDFSGKKFGNLLVVKVLGTLDGRGSVKVYYLCRCGCGREVNCRADTLSNGRATHCGCRTKHIKRQQGTVHGMCYTRTYKTWCGMFDRCYNEGCSGYKNYGGRGIRVCRRWRKFENFLRDMGVKPTHSSIDRINNDGNYEPGNCRWTTAFRQSRNTRRNIDITICGVTRCLQDWVKGVGLLFCTVRRRLDAGWGAREALTTSTRCYIPLRSVSDLLLLWRSQEE